MIDEKKLIEEVEDMMCPFQFADETREWALKDVIEVIEEQSKVNEWIPVSERLPDKPGSYRVTCLYADKWYRVKDDLFYSDKTWAYDNIHRERKVIAWKEIEKPFKGETE